MASSPAHAAEPRPGMGDGTLTLDKATYAPGGTMVISGSGYKANPTCKDAYTGIKLNDGAIDFTDPQASGTVEAGTIMASKTIDGGSIRDANWKISVTLPKDLAEGDSYWIRALTGSDGCGVGSSKFAKFTVKKDAGETPSTGGSEQPGGTTGGTGGHTGGDAGKDKDKVEPRPTLNVDKYDIAKKEEPAGLYQSVYSPTTGKLYATTAVGRPPVKESKLLQVNPTTLAVEKSTDAPVADKETGGRYAVYGIGLDDKNGLIWVSNTRQSTVAVYDRDTLELLAQGSADLLSHPRDVVIDPTTGYAYVSSANRRGEAATGTIGVFSYDPATKAITKVKDITVGDKDHAFKAPMSLTFDPASRTLFTPSLSNPYAAGVNLDSGAITYYDLGSNAKGASGIAYDPEDKALYVANQDSNNVVVVDTQTNKVLAEIPTGAQALNAAYDPTTRSVYVVNRTDGTVTVIDTKTRKEVANLPAGANANHASVGADGVLYVTDKASPNVITRIVPKSADSTGSTDGKDTTGSTDGKDTTGSTGDKGNAPSTGDKGNAPSKDKAGSSTQAPQAAAAKTGTKGGAKAALAKTGVAAEFAALAAVALAAAGGVTVLRRRQG
ncbi:MAG: hypothetical protein E7A62_02215 [Actinomycetaceae bacterium]|nr:hypothetical protein [Actinomycetaceae bacterium]MDU0969794.1 hypothetical protein [Actinomycetaceae bacterium]